MLAVAVGTIALYAYVVPGLPSTAALKDVRFQVPLRVYSRDEKLISEFGEKRRNPLTRAQVPDQMVQAFVASEDQYFFEHPGVDWRGLARAVLHIVRTGSKGPGGSTITMQVARNFFLSREKTYLRKLNEILLSLQIERDLTKDEILELYLNKIFLGHRAYGVGAAAEVYYGLSVDELNLAQVAMIAGLPQRPSADNPITNPPQALARRNYVLSRMLASGFITDAEHKDARAKPISASLHGSIVELQAPFLAEMVRTFVETWAGDQAYSEGFSVYTTVDSRIQAAATQALRKGLSAYDQRHGYRGPELNLPLDAGSTAPDWEARLSDLAPIGGLRAALILEVSEKEAKAYVRGHGEVILPWDSISWARKYLDENRRGPAPKRAGEVLDVGDVVRVRLTEDNWQLTQVPAIEGALVSIDPASGALVALEGGFDFFRSKFNRAVQAKRQPGSNFKPFIYSAALEKGFTAASLINDAPVVFDDPRLESAWRPENYSGKFFGPTRLRLALTKSRNLVSIRLLRRVGIKFALEHAERFGLDTEHLPRDLSLSLGSGTLTPMDVASGYAVFANGGYRVEPYFVSRIVNPRGVTVFEANPPVVCAHCAVSQGAVGKAAAQITATTTDQRTEPRKGDGETPLESGQPPRAVRAISEHNAWIVSSMLRDVVSYGTARKALSLKRKDIAGKTGTTNDQHDAWFSGFVPSLVTTAWVGFDKLAPLGRRETGGQAALPIWIDFMREALVDVPQNIPARPDGLVSVRIDPETGELTDASNPNAIFETFRANHAPQAQSVGRFRTPSPSGSVSGATSRRSPSGGSTPKSAEGTTKRLF
jgi:penicillin-binding protein 1A